MRTEDGYKIRYSEGSAVYIEGRSKYPKLLTTKELTSLNKCCKKRGIGSVTSEGSTVVGGVRFI